MDQARETAGDVLRCAGAYCAWIIGSGFATGQELLRFFARYGRGGRWGTVIVLAGLLLTGPVILAAGYDHREEGNFDHFSWVCGPVLGGIYRRLAPAASALLLPVLLSGAGAALQENWGMDRRAGAALMAALVALAYFGGFRRFSAAAAVAAPAVALFSLIVGAAAAARSAEPLWSGPARAGWAESGLLYLSMNCWGASTYHSRLGASAADRRSAVCGGALGAALISGGVALMSAAIAGCPAAMATQVPALYLAQCISPALGGAFAWVLLAGIFSSCCAMVWTACPGEGSGGKALLMLGAALVLGRLPFARLVARLYPLLGWLGLPFAVCAAAKALFTGDGIFRKKFRHFLSSAR